MMHIDPTAEPAAAPSTLGSAATRSRCSRRSRDLTLEARTALDSVPWGAVPEFQVEIGSPPEIAPSFDSIVVASELEETSHGVVASAVAGYDRLQGVLEHPADAAVAIPWGADPLVEQTLIDDEGLGGGVDDGMLTSFRGGPGTNECVHACASFDGAARVCGIITDPYWRDQCFKAFQAGGSACKWFCIIY
jgi:hypothetical protein